jgi:hypothetical protein
MAFERRVARTRDVIGAEVARTADKSLVARIGLDHSGMDRVYAHPITLAGEFERRLPIGQ